MTYPSEDISQGATRPSAAVPSAPSSGEDIVDVSTDTSDDINEVLVENPELQVLLRAIRGIDKKLDRQSSPPVATHTPQEMEKMGKMSMLHEMLDLADARHAEWVGLANSVRDEVMTIPKSIVDSIERQHEWVADTNIFSKLFDPFAVTLNQIRDDVRLLDTDFSSRDALRLTIKLANILDGQLAYFGSLQPLTKLRVISFNRPFLQEFITRVNRLIPDNPTKFEIADDRQILDLSLPRDVSAQGEFPLLTPLPVGFNSITNGVISALGPKRIRFSV